MTLLKRSLAELVGTFWLVFDGCGSAVLAGIAIPQPIGRPRQRPKRLAGDKGYSSRTIRQWLRAHGISAVTPRKSNERRYGRFDKHNCRRRSVTEQCVGWLKECRRIGTRFEKLALSFLAMFKLAMTQQHLNLLFSDRVRVILVYRICLLLMGWSCAGRL